MFLLLFTNVELSFSRCCSWLKGEPPGTRTLAAKKKCFWRIERKSWWDVIMFYEENGWEQRIGRVCFTFSPRYLGTSVCLCLCFCWGFCLFFLGTYGTQVFCKSLHVLFTYKRNGDRQGFVLDRLRRKKKPEIIQLLSCCLIWWLFLQLFWKVG